MGIWTRWCKSVGELRNMEDIPPLELNRLLGHFFISIKRQNGMVYEPGTLTSFQRSFDRYLREKGRTYSIIKDSIFATSQQSLKAARKSLIKQGKGSRALAAEALTDDEIEQMWQTKALGDASPESLMHTMWFLICTHMGMRGCDEHQRYRFGDFQVITTSDSKQYIEFC